MFLVLGILIGHVSLRIVTTDSSLYTRAAAGADYTTRFMVVGDWGRGGELLLLTMLSSRLPCCHPFPFFPGGWALTSG